MADIRKELLDIYGRHKVDEVAKSPQYVGLCENNKNDFTFNATRDRIERSKLNLEKYVGIQESYSAQVKFTLKLINRLSKESEREEYKELALKAYGDKWNKKQKDFFNESYERLKTFKDYFLSFTNRNDSKDSQNLINRDHRHFIIDILGTNAFEKKDIGKNLLAEAIHHLLKEKEIFEGFYYPEHENDSSVVKEKLTKNCQNTFSFLQLVQKRMFKQDDGRENYCHFEFNESNIAVSEDRAIFLMTDERNNIIDDNVNLDYDDWMNCIADRATPHLEKTNKCDPDIIDKNSEHLEQYVIKKIKEHKKRLFDQVPN